MNKNERDKRTTEAAMAQHVVEWAFGWSDRLTSVCVSTLAFEKLKGITTREDRDDRARSLELVARINAASVLLAPLVADLLDRDGGDPRARSKQVEATRWLAERFAGVVPTIIANAISMVEAARERDADELFDKLGETDKLSPDTKQAVDEAMAALDAILQGGVNDKS